MFSIYFIPALVFAGGKVYVELLSFPTYVTPYETIDIKVRIKFSGNKDNGPWEAQLCLYDDDAIIDDLIDEFRFIIQQQDQWYEYTFENINLSLYQEALDENVELYAFGEVDDNIFNGYSPDGSSNVCFVKIEQNDPYEENNSFESAKDITQGIHKELKCYNEDWFSINVLPGNSLEVQAIYEKEDGEIFIELFNSLHQRVASSIANDHLKKLSHVIDQANNYYIKIFGDPINYELSVLLDDIYELNDDFQHAAKISSKYHPNLFYRNTDWYKIYVYFGKLDIFTEFETNISSSLSLFSSSENELKTSNNNRLSYDIMFSGFYWIKIDANSGNTSSYNLTIENSTNSIELVPAHSSQDILLNTSLSWLISHLDIHAESCEIFLGKETPPMYVETVPCLNDLSVTFFSFFSMFIVY